MRKINAYTKNDIYVDTFASQSEAATKLGTHITSINRALKGRNKTSCGLVWYYEDEDPHILLNEVKNNELLDGPID